MPKEDNLPLRFIVTHWLDDKQSESRTVYAANAKEAAEIAAKKSMLSIDESWEVPASMLVSINGGSKIKFKDL